METVTLFNRVGDTWQTIKLKAHVERDMAHIRKKYGLESASVAVIHLFNLDDYLPPKEWKKERAGFTVQTGDDFFMIGEWDGEQVVEECDYPLGFHDYLFQTYDYAYVVKSVSGPFTLIPHLEIAGAGE